MQYDPIFRMYVNNPLPDGGLVSWIDINTRREALSWTTGPGGYGGCNVGLRVEGQPAGVAELLSSLAVPDLAHVEIWAPSTTGFAAYQGRATEVDDDSGLEVKAFSCAGYGTADGAFGDEWFYVSPTETGDTGNVMDDVERSAGGLLYRMVPAVTDIVRMSASKSLFQDPGGGYTPRQQSGRYLSQAIDQIVKAGSDGGLDLMFAVYEDRVLQMRLIDPPLDDNGKFVPTYRVGGDRRITWKRSFKRMVGSVAVQYTPPGQPQQVTPTIDIDGWADSHGGLFRSILIPSSAITEVQALLVRDRYARKNSVAARTGTFTVTADQPLVGPLGPVPYYMARYGQWAAVGKEVFFVTGTKVDASGRRATITVQNVPGFEYLDAG